MSADLLRRAADRIEALAKGASPAPWVWTWREDWGCGEWHTVTSSATDFDVAAGGYEGGGVEREEDAKWIAILGPQIAGPLAAWLRGEATQHMAETFQPHGATVEYAGPALAVARAILEGAPE